MRATRPINRPYLVTGLVLLAAAAVTAWDASTMRIRANFGFGADAASYLVAGLLVLLALGHFVGAVRGAVEMPADDVDFRAMGWVGLGLAGLIGTIWLGGGFILAATLLFAFTARAFGRKAILVDLLIGAVLGLIVYLLFNRLLTLALPSGPLERLI
jgi:putative tricarboxylic transport membrane protein